MSCVEIGMLKNYREASIPLELHRAPAGCFAAAAGSTAPTAAEWRTATATTRRARAAASGSGCSAVQPPRAEGAKRQARTEAEPVQPERSFRIQAREIVNDRWNIFHIRLNYQAKMTT